ncbi:MAG: hypothetical protein A7316_03075 [Candidatus Altiarchaeales archaeon WOR_SM1_86-2]|nr:MAG: hypothetical protein A7316_03075 [Candidatus Altiarchaeales archaeon WOR_SM1_86-2]ODS40936.1 MAG: hypothetical protein A7315_15400 [Candidatus Altiarchaeales archaeon WOR_SM1_79]
MKINRTTLENALAIQNSWWKTKQVKKEKLGEFQREMLLKIYEKLDENNVVSIIGPRRTGKTVLLHQIIQKLLDDGINEKRIVYLPLDNPNVRGDNLLDELMDFITSMVYEPADDLTEPVYIFLDEAHKLETWSQQIKYWHDLGLKISFIISGSSALRILKGSGESLLGRIDHNILLPLSFREFLSVRYGLNVEAHELDIGKIKKNHYDLIPNQQKIKIALKDYLHRGGYPALVNTSIDKTFQILLEYKDLSIQRDIFEIEEIRNTKTLNELIYLLASLVGNRLSYNKLGSAILSRVNTVKRYLAMLEDIYLVKESLVYKKPYSAVRQERKVFFIDTGMVNALNMNYELKDMPALVENAVASMVYRKNLKSEINPLQHYWVETKEVDVVANIRGSVIPIEVKYRETPSDIGGLLRFMEKFNAENGIVVTKNLFKEDGDILYVPAWLFMLCV